MKLKRFKGGRLSEGEYDAARFGDKVLFRTLKEAVDMYRSNSRQGTVKTIGRDEVSGSNKKPWKQKHTGRARAGDRKSPIWRGGGTVFGPKPRDWSYHLPIKERRVALRSALRGKLDGGEVLLVDLPAFERPSAKAAREVLLKSGALERQPTEVRALLLLIARHDPLVWKSFRNFPDLRVRTAADVCAMDVLGARLVLAEEPALDAVAERVGAARTTGRRTAADAGAAP